MIRFVCITIVLIAATTFMPSSVAGSDDQMMTDAIYLPGSNIPIAGITIERIAAGQIIYRDARGRRHQRNMEDVSSVYFGLLPQLHQAEQHVLEGDYGRAVPHYLQALVQTKSDMQRLWIHSRLARAHDIRGEYAQAASHAAAAFMLEPHIVWRDIEPIRDPREDVPIAAIIEARQMLREARQRVAHRDLAQAVERMSRRIEQMFEAAQPIELGADEVPHRSTWSGFSIERIREENFATEAAAELDNASPIEPPIPPAAPEDGIDRSPPALVPQREPAQQNSTALDRIERLLDERRYADALDQCQQLARNVAETNVARLLYAYGRALRGTGQPQDAAVMFTRCAILYPDSEFALRSLIQTAAIYHEHYQRLDPAVRLLDRAAASLRDDSPEVLRAKIERLRAAIAGER